MQINDVINQALEIINSADLTYDSDDPKVKQLFDCANCVYSELTSEYLSLRKVEKRVFKNSKVWYTEFEEPVREILKVNNGGSSVKFTMYPDYVCCEGFEGEAYVEYIYKGKALKKNSSMSLPPQFSEYTIAMGVASEYCYRNGLLDEALYYKSRYETSIVNLARKLGGFRLPQRRFIC